MFTRPPDLSDGAVVRTLESRWHLAVDDVEYVPVGFGSHHWKARSDGRVWFVTVDDLDAKRLSEVDSRQAAAQRLTAAMVVAVSLRELGLDFVAAPISSERGLASEPIDDRFVVSIFEYLDGETHPFGAYPTSSARLAVLDRIARLHQVPPSSIPALEERFVIPRREVVTAGASIDGNMLLGPYSADALDLLSHHRDSLTGAFDRFDSIVSVAIEQRSGWVVTHGEPHQANTINTPDRGVLLIDWDTVLVAPPERDLWSLIRQDEDIAHEYTKLTGWAIDGAIINLYELFWDLTEVCLYAADFLAPHERTADTEVAWESFQRYLDPSRWTPG
ncbi:MAG: phosphotransferase [Acidimicrobiia bacterium]|nr:phosphotransferase [Acidimicrobiia bacterium]